MRFAGFFVIAFTIGLLSQGDPLGAQVKEKDKDPKDPKDLKPKPEETPSYIGGKMLADWVKDLKHPDASVRQQAIRTVVGFGPPAKLAVPTLMSTSIRDQDASLRGDAAAALGMIASMERGVEVDEVPKVTLALCGLLGPTETQRTVRLQAALAIAQMGPRAKSAVPFLRDNSKDQYSWELRKAVAFALGRVGMDPNRGPEPIALSTLIALLKDPCAPVRLEAILALSAMGRSKVAAELEGEKLALKAMEKDVDKNVAIWSQVLLMFLDPALITKEKLDAIDKITLKDPDPKIRSAGARAIGTLGDRAKALIPTLQKKARGEDESLEVIITAIAALGMMVDVAPETVLPELEALLKDREIAVRIQAARVLGNIGKAARPAVPKLTQLLRDKDENVQYTAIQALAALGEHSVSAVPLLQDVAKNHPEEWGRKAAEEAVKIITEAQKKKNAQQ